MDIDGDIKVWTDGDKVCARLHADGPEGPIVVQASAPLAPIRRRIVRAFARKGVTISGDEPGYGATIENIARRKALKRLRLMAPTAFSKRGLASYLARGELMKRRRRRRRLARAGRPVGAKAIGPVPPGQPQPQQVRRRRWSRFGRWARPLIPAALVTTSAALTPFLIKSSAKPGRPALPPAAPPPPRAPGAPVAAQGAGSYSSPGDGPGNASTTDASDASAEEEPSGGEGDREATSRESDEAEQAQGRGNETDGEEEGQGDDAGEGDEADGGVDGDAEGGGEVSGEEPPLTRRHVRQALVLLHAARRHPKARRRVHQIVQLAGIGEPTAKKALKALKVAKQIKSKAKKATVAKPKAVLPSAPPSQPTKVLAAPTTRASLAPMPAALPETNPTGGVRRWLDVFALWRRGVG